MFFFRDLEYLISVGLMAMYFMTPIMYNITILPEKYQKILLLVNPMAGYVVLYRNIMYYGMMKRPLLLIYVLLYSFLVFFVGYFVFQKLQRKFAEIL